MRQSVLVAMIVAVLAAVGGVLMIALAPPTAPPTAGAEDGAAGSRSRRHHSEPDSPPPPAEREPEPDTVEPPAPKPPAEIPLGAGRLRGVVIDEVDRAPVAGAVVRLLHPAGERIAETATDAGGEYGFERMPDAVPLVLELEAPGYLSGLCCDVRLTAAQLLRKDVQLVRSPELGLTLTEHGSRVPAAGALVHLSLDGAPVARTTTDEAGRVRLALPAFGEFVLRLGGAVYAEHPGERVRVLPGRGDLELERRVLPGAALRVRVFGPTNDPATNANVTVSAEGLSSRIATTDLRGEALFSGLATKTNYEVVTGYDDEDHPPLRGRGATRVFADRERVLDVLLRPAGRVTGRVTRADGTGIAGAKVTVVLRGGTRATTVRADAEGRFDATRLAGGKVRLEVEAPGYAKSESRAVVTPWEPDDEGPASDVRLVPLPPAVVTGRVTDRAGRELRAVVRAVPFGVRAETDAGGRYRLELPAGIDEQRLVASAEGHCMPTDGPHAAPAVEALSGREQQVDFVLAPVPPDADAPSGGTTGDEEAPESSTSGAASVTGRLIDDRSAPVSRATLSCGGVSASTDADGRFDLVDVPFLDAEAGILPVLGVAPPPGLLMPERVTLPPVGANVRVAEVGEVRLAARPIAILDLTGAHPGAAPDRPPTAFTLAFSHPDHLAGARTPRMSPLRAVSYDGTWMHVPPADAWREDGNGRVWALVPTSRGGATSQAAWRLRPGATDTLRLSGADTVVAVRVSIPAAYVSGRLTFREQVSRHAGPARAASASGEASPSSETIARDPFGSEMTTRSFSETMRGRTMDMPDVPRGLWSVELTAPKGTKLPVLHAKLDTESGEGRPQVVFKTR